MDVGGCHILKDKYLVITYNVKKMLIHENLHFLMENPQKFSVTQILKSHFKARIEACSLAPVMNVLAMDPLVL